MKAPRSYLFVPGNRPERFGKALASGADRVILDLEDAVAPADKAAARDAVSGWLAGNAAALERVVLRVNDSTSDCHAADLELAGRLAVRCVMLPKCESARQVDAVRAAMVAQGRVLALVETARGVLALQEIAQAAGVERLAFGSVDYALDLDLPAPVDPLEPACLALDVAATQLAIASRAAALPAPVAGVTLAIDAVQVARDMRHMRALGYGAKMCIHPAQLAAVHEVLHPGAEELAWARRVLQAWQAAAGGVLQLDGRMVDKPVILRAQRIVELARASAASGAEPG